MAGLAGAIVEQIVNSPHAREGLGLEEALTPIMEELINLDYTGWHLRFASDGIPEEQIAALDSMVSEWIKTVDSDGLSRMLENVRDMGDDSEMAGVLGRWLKGVPQERVFDGINEAGFPNRLEAVCYAVSELGRVFDVAVEFENMTRELAEQGAPDGLLTPEQEARGIAMAEAGLAEDVKAWSRS